MALPVAIGVLAFLRPFAIRSVVVTEGPGGTLKAERLFDTLVRPLKSVHGLLLDGNPLCDCSYPAHGHYTSTCFSAKTGNILVICEDVCRSLRFSLRDGDVNEFVSAVSSGIELPDLRAVLEDLQTELNSAAV